MSFRMIACDLAKYSGRRSVTRPLYSVISELLVACCRSVRRTNMTELCGGPVVLVVVKRKSHAIRLRSHCFFAGR